MAHPGETGIPVFRVENLAAYTPAETIEIVSRAGVKKGNMRSDKVFLSAVSAGCLLSFAAASALSTNTAPWFQENAPGLIRSAGAIIFPFGLVMIVYVYIKLVFLEMLVTMLINFSLTGADLCTGTFMYTTVTVLHGRLSIWRMLLHWFLCFWGNLAGSLFVVAIIFGYGGTFDTDPYKSEVQSFVTKKQITPQFHMIFLRGIGCNWLVCLACFFGMQGKDLASKILGIWWPIFAFVSLGLDHVVANMFFIPLGIWQHTPGLTVGLYIWKGIIPAGLGNIIGGALFCGGYYWWMYLFQEPPVKVDGLTYEPYEEVRGVTLHFRRPQRDTERGLNGKTGDEEVRGPEETVLGG